ncbi:hypothetical protein SAMN05216229_10311 [Geopseudomonas sagittaria]|uniref:Uncharacterized protein n=1 Tax=Geopseudomonas sagittaria TaxID=1135990 RepID=A0A1I5QVJ5_9GAMM|nr:hypothetical protein SAMN05216229_10311 [Pseudomonas sagittaria]
MRLQKWGRRPLSSDTHDLVSTALAGFDRIYLPGYRYQKLASLS